MSSTENIEDINNFITDILLRNLVATTIFDNDESLFYIRKKNLSENLWPTYIRYSWIAAPNGKQITEGLIFWTTKKFVDQDGFEQIINEVRRCAEHNIHNYKYNLVEDLKITVVVLDEEEDRDSRSQDLIFRPDDDNAIVEDVKYMIEYGDNSYNTSLTESMSLDKVLSLLESYIDKYLYVNVRSSDNDISAKEIF